MSLFSRMLHEELRLHAELFGSRRFVAFPVFVAALVAGAVQLLLVTETALGAIVAGIHLLVLFFGLQVGTMGLIGRDAMRDVLGDVTLLVFAARTLPVSRRRLLATFLAKDLCYYVILFVTPVAVGFVPLVVTGEFAPAGVVLLWLTVGATFAFGAAASLTLAGIGTRSTAGLLVLVAALGVGVVLAPATTITLTPYGLYADPSLTTAITGLAPTLALTIAGPLVFEPPGSGGVRRIETDRFRQLQTRLGALAARPLLEVSRSSGSVWKVAFSLGILFAVTALLLDRLVIATALDPSAGIAFGTLLGLGTFTTYNWVTQFDDPREYLRYPADLDDVFAGKQRAFLLLSVPTGLVYLALAGIWYPPADLLVGAVVFPLVAIYVFGVTGYLTGLAPNELLFDTPLFALYGLALATVAVPLLVAGLAAGDAPLVANGSAIGISALAALVGVGLSRRTGRRWHRRLRRR